MKLEFSIFHFRGGEEFTMRVSWNHLKNEVWIALEIRPRHDIILSCCDVTEVFSICKQGHDFKSRHCDVKLRKFLLTRYLRIDKNYTLSIFMLSGSIQFYSNLQFNMTCIYH